MVVMRTFTSSSIKKILSYEVPSSTEQSSQLNIRSFIPNYYVNIEEHLDKKLEAINCYETEIRKFPHPRSSEGVEVLARKRGTEIGFSAAEAFVLIRGKWE